MYEYKAKLIRVVDGDTLVADIDLGFHIHVRSYLRFARINAPELRAKEQSERDKAKKVKVRVIEILEKNPIQKIIVTKSGKYQNRYISEIILTDETNLSDTLLTEGIVKEY